jgi:hypothetical protein
MQRDFVPIDRAFCVEEPVRVTPSVYIRLNVPHSDDPAMQGHLDQAVRTVKSFLELVIDGVVRDVAQTRMDRIGSASAVFGKPLYIAATNFTLKPGAGLYLDEAPLESGHVGFRPARSADLDRPLVCIDSIDPSRLHGVLVKVCDEVLSDMEATGSMAYCTSEVAGAGGHRLETFTATHGSRLRRCNRREVLSDPSGISHARQRAE